MRLLRFFCLLLIMVSCAGRSGPPAFVGDKAENVLPRAAPPYVHFLQKQAMLTEAPGIVAQVSQSGRLWLQGAAPGRREILLRAAPNWLELTPSSNLQPVFKDSQALLQHGSRLGITGLYLGHTGEKSGMWLSKKAIPEHTAPASLQFDSSFGTEEEFEQLAAQAEALGMEVGSSILPGATGIGPDFLLQSRHAPDFGGIYAMVPIDPADRSTAALLPVSKEEWDFQPLTQGVLSAMATRGLIPENVVRDALPWASPGGWAVTGSVTGMDGVARRWLYRYASDVRQPVLAWPDPSGNAAKVFAAAIIRGTGLLGQSLVGLHFEPLLSLEPGKPSPDFSLSPGLDAINELSRQAHRYGGWTLQADAVPATVIEAVLAGAADFCRDDVTESLALFGFLNADGRPLASLYRQWIGQGLDFTRLARGVDAAGGLSPRVLMDKWSAQAEKLRTVGETLTPQLIASYLDTDEARSQWDNFQLAWRLGLPGLVFLPQTNAGDVRLTRTLRLRKEAGLALGKPVAVTRGSGGGFGLLSALPGGGYWLLACNFGIYGDSLNIALPDDATRAVNVATGDELGLNGHNFHIALDGRAAMNVIFLK